MNIRSKMKPNVEFSTAPIADIVFLLLIYFMLTSTFVINRSLDVNLPESSSKQSSISAHTITVTEDLRYAWDGEIVDKEEIPALIRTAVEGKADDERKINIKMDRETVVNELVYVMSAATKYRADVTLLAKPER